MFDRQAIATIRRFWYETLGASAVDFCVIAAATAGIATAVIGAVKDGAVDNVEITIAAGGQSLDEG